jgi:hypothetical protein
MQTQARQKIGLTFAKLLRSFLRLDPDVILVGEMGDEETATIGFDAAQTGHLLLSTIHTNDAVAAVSRLLDLNIDHSQMASSLLGVLAQRLCRQICFDCRVSYTPEEEEWRSFFNTYPEHLSFYKGEGCETCGFTGYKGRVLISEIFEVTPEVSRALSRGASEREIKQIAMDGGMKTLVDDGIQKLHQTTLSEVIRVVPHELIKEHKNRQTMESGRGGLQTVISNPEIQGDLIEGFFEQYEKLCQQNGGISDRADKAAFKSFLLMNYKDITDRYGCSRVAFSLKKGDDKVDIYAQPDMVK